ncbi:sigma-54-dependent Fis family transcriptional regulator [Candidatus Sumerlaeota bacterium]|nr:sigma-54-dependent Fis family transcriptional regulator [Candidatus Sumerlaeota bacterium]
MSTPRTSILIIEDERPMRQFLEEFLSGLGYDCRSTAAGRPGIEAYRERPVDVVLIDLRLPDIDGMQVCRAVREQNLDPIIILMTGYPTSESALEAYEAGADDYLTKPFSTKQLHLVIHRVIEHRRLINENERLRQLLEGRSCFDQLVGGAPAMQAIYKLIEQVAPSQTPVLITGEPGTGKSLVAAAIHRASGHSGLPLEVLDCSSVPREDLEIALFGVEGEGDGFASVGALERAGEGTLHLKSVEALPPLIQSRLQSALQSQEILRVGASETVSLRARVVTSSSAQLLALAERDEFRRDLYYRLSVVTVSMPPLRERREDIPLLAHFFLEKIARALDQPAERIDHDAVMALMSHAWPGNVTELEETLRKIAENGFDGTIRLRDLPGRLQREAEPRNNGVSAANVPLKEAKRRFEREYFCDLLRRSKGNMSLASRRSRVGRPYLYKKINDHQINPDDFR